MYWLKAFNAFFLTILLLTAASTRAQYTTVIQATAETEDHVSFLVKANQQMVVWGKDIVLNYSVKNNSSKSIYLVREKSYSFDTGGDSILVMAPIPAPIEHGEYNYTFIKIARGKTYQGQISIPSNVYSQLGISPIDIGFGYVTDIYGLDRQLSKNEDPIKLRGLLNSRLKVVVVGKLSVNVIQEKAKVNGLRCRNYFESRKNL